MMNVIRKVVRDHARREPGRKEENMKINIGKKSVSYEAKEVTITLENQGDESAFYHLAGCWNAQSYCTDSEAVGSLARRLLEAMKKADMHPQ